MSKRKLIEATHFAVIHNGDLLGVGLTEAEAREAAVLSAILEEDDGYEDGDGHVAPATAAIAEQFEDGAVPDWCRMPDGTVCTVDKAAAQAEAQVADAGVNALPRAYRVTTPDQDCGIYSAYSAAHAVLLHLRDVGYGPDVVTLADGELVYAQTDENWAHVLGGLDRYTVSLAYADGGVGEDWLLGDSTAEAVARDFGVTEMSDSSDIEDAADSVVSTLRDDDGLAIGRDIALAVMVRGHREMLAPVV